MDEKLKKLHNELSDLENNKEYICMVEKIRRKRMEISNFKHECVHEFEVWREGMEIYDDKGYYYGLAVCKNCGIQKDVEVEDCENMNHHKDYKWEDIKVN